MVFTVLDIGAGSLEFAKRLARRNPFKRMLIFAGEPEWPPFSLPRNVVNAKEAARFMTNGRIGEFRIVSKYDSFAFADESLDGVTLNAPNPFLGLPVRVERELERCLKPGGIFFYTRLYPYNIALPSNFARVSEGFWSQRAKMLWFDRTILPDGAPTRFPASRTIRENLKTQRIRVNDPDAYERRLTLSRRPRSSFIYWQTGVSPTYQLWIKR